MQKVKRKNAEGEDTFPNKKLKQNKNEITTESAADKKKNVGKKVQFKKDGKGPPGKKDKQFGKTGKKGAMGKDGKFSKDQNNGEKPKWSEMKKEKKQLRIVRRKAKASAEVFEISHKAKLLAAQIQRYAPHKLMLLTCVILLLFYLTSNDLLKTIVKL